MSIYSGFSSRKLEYEYNVCIDQLLSLLATRSIKHIQAERVDEDKFKKIFKKLFKYLQRMEAHKYLHPKFSETLTGLARVLRLKILDPLRISPTTTQQHYNGHIFQLLSQQQKESKSEFKEHTIQVTTSNNISESFHGINHTSNNANNSNNNNIHLINATTRCSSLTRAGGIPINNSSRPMSMEMRNRNSFHHKRNIQQQMNPLKENIKFANQHQILINSVINVNNNNNSNSKSPNNNNNNNDQLNKYSYQPQSTTNTGYNYKSANINIVSEEKSQVNTSNGDFRNQKEDDMFTLSHLTKKNTIQQDDDNNNHNDKENNNLASTLKKQHHIIKNNNYNNNNDTLIKKQQLQLQQQNQILEPIYPSSTKNNNEKDRCLTPSQIQNKIINDSNYKSQQKVNSKNIEQQQSFNIIDELNNSISGGGIKTARIKKNGRTIKSNIGPDDFIRRESQTQAIPSNLRIQLQLQSQNNTPSQQQQQVRKKSSQNIRTQSKIIMNSNKNNNNNNNMIKLNDSSNSLINKDNINNINSSPQKSDIGYNSFYMETSSIKNLNKHFIQSSYNNRPDSVSNKNHSNNNNQSNNNASNNNNQLSSMHIVQEIQILNTSTTTSNQNQSHINQFNDMYKLQTSQKQIKHKQSNNNNNIPPISQSKNNYINNNNSIGYNVNQNQIQNGISNISSQNSSQQQFNYHIPDDDATGEIINNTNNNNNNNNNNINKNIIQQLSQQISREQSINNDSSSFKEFLLNSQKQDLSETQFRNRMMAQNLNQIKGDIDNYQLSGIGIQSQQTRSQSLLQQQQQVQQQQQQQQGQNQLLQNYKITTTTQINQQLNESSTNDNNPEPQIIQPSHLLPLYPIQNRQQQHNSQQSPRFVSDTFGLADNQLSLTPLKQSANAAGKRKKSKKKQQQLKNNNDHDKKLFNQSFNNNGSNPIKNIQINSSKYNYHISPKHLQTNDSK